MSQLYEYFEDSTYVYLVQEMCDNGEFYSYLKAHRTTLSEPEARHYMKQVVEGLLYLHSHHILHRDLTLANLLLTKDMNIVSSASIRFMLKLAHCRKRKTCSVRASRPVSVCKATYSQKSSTFEHLANSYS